MKVKVEVELEVVTGVYIDDAYQTFSPERAAETVRAALYKTYANPTREDAGISQVRNVRVV